MNEQPTDEQRFSAAPEIPKCPTDIELNDFYLMCAEVMAGQPTTPPIMALKAGISIMFAMRAEIERLRIEAGYGPTSAEEAQQLLQDLITKAQSRG